MPGKCYHLFVLPIIPVLITDIVKAVSPDYTIIYFDTDTGKKIEQSEFQERKNKEAQKQSASLIKQMKKTETSNNHQKQSKCKFHSLNQNNISHKQSNIQLKLFCQSTSQSKSATSKSVTNQTFPEHKTKNQNPHQNKNSSHQKTVDFLNPEKTSSIKQQQFSQKITINLKSTQKQILSNQQSKCLTSSSKANDNLIHQMCQKGNNAFSKQQWKEASKHYQEALQQMPHRTDFSNKKKMAELLAEGTKQEKIANKNISQAMDLQEMHRYQETLVLFESAMTHYRNAQQIYSQLNKEEKSFQTKFFEQAVPKLNDKIEYLQQILSQQINLEEKQTSYKEDYGSCYCLKKKQSRVIE